MTVSEGGSQVCSVTAVAGIWSCDTSALSETSHTFDIVSSDAAGNSTNGTSITFTVDATAPAAPSVSAPTEGALLTTATPTISGTGEAGASLTVTDEADNVLCSLTVPGDGNWSCVSTTLSQGVHTISVRQVDAAANTSPTVTRSFSVDSIAPEAPAFTNPVDGSTITTTTPSVRGTGESGTLVTVSEGGSQVCSVTPVGGIWSCDTSALSETAHTFDIVSSDAAGNSTSGTSITFTVDATAPAAPTISAPAEGALLTTVTPTISGTGEPGATLTVTDESSNVLCSLTVPVDGNWSCTSAALAEGAHTLSVKQVDAAANTSPTVTRSITVDTVAPVGLVVSDPVDGDAINTTTPTFTGEGEVGASISITDENNVQVCTTTVGTDGTWSCTTSTLTEGSHEFTVVMADAAGNSTSVGPIGLTVDVTAPVTPVITSPVNNSIIRTTPQTITGTAEPGTTIDVSPPTTTFAAPEFGAGAMLFTSFLVNECSTTADSAGVWSCELNLEEGSYELVALSTDAAGNTSLSGTISVRIDTPPGPVTGIKCTRDGSAVTCSGTGQPGAKVKVTSGSGSAVCTVTIPSNGRFSCKGTLPPGQGTVKVVISDGGGDSPPQWVAVATGPNGGNGGTGTGGSGTSGSGGSGTSGPGGSGSYGGARGPGGLPGTGSESLAGLLGFALWFSIVAVVARGAQRRTGR